jgi:hypothetical protein
VPPSDLVSSFIEGFSPTSVPPEVAAFARRVVAAASPTSRMRTKDLLSAASRLGLFASDVGLVLDEQVLLKEAMIERFSGTERVGSLASRRTWRANLRYLARYALIGAPKAPVMSRDRTKAPYSPNEIASYLALCAAQPTTLRRHRGNALICLGAGAGIIGSELRNVKGTDVKRRSGGLVVSVSGRRARVVPVTSDYHDCLAEAAAFFGDRYLLTGTNPNCHNVTTPLVSSLSGGSDLERLSASRLRATYLVAVAKRIGLKAFMDAAGIASSSHLGELVSGLESPSEEVVVALLGAAAPQMSPK